MQKTDMRQKVIGATYTTSGDDGLEGIVLDRDNEVKRTGYRSAQDQIAEFTRAGMVLQSYREDRYAEPTGINPRYYGEIDQTVADDKVNNLRQTMKNRIQEAKDKTQADLDEQAAKKAEKEKVATETPPEGTPPRA